MTVGERIKQRRKQLGITLDELGKRCGVEKSAIHKYESGMITGIPLPRLEKIAIALDCSPSYLMGWDNEPNEKTATKASDGLSPTDELLVMMFNNLSDEGKAKVIRLMKEIIDKNK